MRLQIFYKQPLFLLVFIIFIFRVENAWSLSCNELSSTPDKLQMQQVDLSQAAGDLNRAEETQSLKHLRKRLKHFPFVILEKDHPDGELIGALAKKPRQKNMRLIFSILVDLHKITGGGVRYFLDLESGNNSDNSRSFSSENFDPKNATFFIRRHHLIDPRQLEWDLIGYVAIVDEFLTIKKFKEILASMDLKLEPTTLPEMAIHGNQSAKSGTISSIVHKLATKRNVRSFLAFNLPEGDAGAALGYREIHISNSFLDELVARGELQAEVFVTILHEIKHTAVARAAIETEFDHRRISFNHLSKELGAIGPFDDLEGDYSDSFRADEVEARIGELGTSQVYSRNILNRITTAMDVRNFIKVQEFVLNQGLLLLRDSKGLNLPIVTVEGDYGVLDLSLSIDYERSGKVFHIQASYPLFDWTIFRPKAYYEGFFIQLFEARLRALNRFSIKIDKFFENPKVMAYIKLQESALEKQPEKQPGM